MKQVFIKPVSQPNCPLIKVDRVIISTKDNQRFIIIRYIDDGDFGSKNRKIYAYSLNKSKEAIENYIVDLENAGYLEIENC